MREIRTSGSEGGEAGATGLPYPYRAQVEHLGQHGDASDAMPPDRLSVLRRRFFEQGVEAGGGADLGAVGGVQHHHRLDALGQL
jgi:hypothetical protein